MSFGRLMEWIPGPKDNNTTRCAEVSQPHDPLDHPQEVSMPLPSSDREVDNTSSNDSESEHSFSSESDEIDDEIMEHAMDDAEEIVYTRQRHEAEMVVVLREEMLARNREGEIDTSSSDTIPHLHQTECIFNKSGMEDDDDNNEPMSLEKAEADTKAEASVRYLLTLRWLLLLWKMKDLLSYFRLS